jgi:glycosyltransferase involved in cell wall biosynthesis
MSPTSAAARPAGQRILINGKFLSAPATGVQRVARELVLALDADLAARPGPAAWELLAAEDADAGFRVSSIRKRRIKGKGGAAWEQLTLARAANGGLLVSLANSAPILHRPGVVMLHDAQVYDTPDSYSSAFRAWYRFLHPVLARNSRAILTVSDYSRGRLATNGVTDLAQVVANGFDHILAAQLAPDALSRHGLESGRYVLAFASAQPHKNTRLLLDLFSAPREDGVVLVLIGGHLPEGAAVGGPQVRRLGRVDDPDLRALYAGAAAFLSPSLTEGFGLPAGEAALCGAPVVVARAGAQAEIWDRAGLCEAVDDPAAWRRRIDALIGDSAYRQSRAAAALEVARGYTWASSARKLRGIVEALV